MMNTFNTTVSFPSKEKTNNRKRSAITVKDIIACRQNKIRKHTEMVDLSLLKHLEAFADKEVNIKIIDTDFCRGFADYLVCKATIKPSSATTYMQKLHTLLQDAVSMGFIKTNPMPPIAKLLPKHTSTQRSNLDIKDIEKLTSAHCPHLTTKLAFLFSCYTGLRLSDIETLKWDNIHRYNGIQMLTKIQVKTNSEVNIPLGKQALHILQQVKTMQLSDGGNIFPLYSRTTVYADLRQWAANAGIDKHITFHTSRITFVTLSISAGINMYVISKLCGHKDIKTTLTYARMIDDTYLCAITMFERIFKTYKKKQKSVQSVELLI